MSIDKEKEKKPKPSDSQIEEKGNEKKQWKSKYDDSTIRIRLEKTLYDKLIQIKEINANQKLSLNKIINRLYDSYVKRNPQYASSISSGSNTSTTTTGIQEMIPPIQITPSVQNISQQQYQRSDLQQSLVMNMMNQNPIISVNQPSQQHLDEQKESQEDEKD